MEMSGVGCLDAAGPLQAAVAALGCGAGGDGVHTVATL
jgi:hypothetical protein